MNKYQEEMLRLISILARKLPQESLNEVNEQLRKIDHEYEKVEKALDKACAELYLKGKQLNELDKRWYSHMSEEEWKEWLLSDE